MLLAASVAFAAAAAAPAKKPHIVVICVDDLGWNGFGFNSENAEVVTPHVDALAKQGLILDRHYAYRFCSPSRAALFSGRTPGHGIWALNPGATVPVGVNLNVSYIPKMLAKAGYVSYQIGKWHQGYYHPDFTPVGRGFNHSFGFLLGGSDHMSSCAACANKFPANPDYADHIRSCPANPRYCNLECPQEGGVDLYRDDHPAVGENGTYTAFLWAGEAVKIINAHDPKVPLFMAVMLHDVHQPVEAPPEFLVLYPGDSYNTSNMARRYYNAMHSVTDAAIGNITDAMKTRNLYDNSFLLVYSDNGGTSEHGEPVPGSSNYPLRGFKYSFFEGGTRVTAFVHSPLLPQKTVGKRTKSIFHITDWYVTFCELAGVTSDDGFAAAPVDGVSAWDRLIHPAQVVPRPAATWKGGTAKDEVLLGMYDQDGKTLMGALLQGDMKLIVGTQGQVQSGWSAQYPGTSPSLAAPSAMCATGDGCLFNLTHDPREEHDLAQSSSKLAQTMRKRWEALVQTHTVPNGHEERAKDFVLVDGCMDVPVAVASACGKVKKTGFFEPWEQKP